MDTNCNSMYALIMAGGEGTRFYPLSTPERPKQFLNFIGEKSFIRQTFERILPLIPSENIYVSTNEKYVDLVKEELPEISAANIIAEPVKRNTAPAIAYAAKLIMRRDSDAVMCCLPSDHHINDEEGFRRVLRRASEITAKGYLVTLGMKPAWPSPEYGYIHPGKALGDWAEAAKFTEKPDKETAEEYVRTGCLWNGGIFIWRTKDFLNELSHCAPDIYQPLSGFKEGYEFCRNYFLNAPSISVDYALMEKSKKVAVIPTSVGWSDVGTWDSIKQLIDHGVKVSSFVKSALHGDDTCPWRCIVPKPWGHEELWAYTPHYAGKILFIRKGHRLSLQYHQIKVETIRILSGRLELELGEGIKRRMNTGDVQHIPPGTEHRMHAVNDCLVLEVSTTELDDVVRLHDDYGRKEVKND